MYEKTIVTETGDVTAKIFGSYDFNARLIEKAFDVNVRNRAVDDGDAIIVSGNEAEGVESAAVSFKEGTAIVTSNSACYADLKKVVEDAGYDVVG